MVFAETPLWCGAPFPEKGLPFAERVPPYADKWAPFADGRAPFADEGAPFSERGARDYYDATYELPYDDRSTNDRSTTDSRSPDEYRVVKAKQKFEQHPSWESGRADYSQPEMVPREKAHQVQYVPVPVPMPSRDGGVAPGMWNEAEHHAAQKQAPVMIPVPVPVPVPMGADPSAAVNASIAAAGQDMYNAFFSAYPRGYPPQVQAPMPNFVPPPGYKLVPAMPNHMNPGAQGFAHARQDFHSVPEREKKFTTSTKAWRSNNRNGKGHGKVFVGGLSPATSVEMLREHFSQFGKLSDVSVIKDPITKLSRGFGFVEFENGIPTNLLDVDHMIDKRKCGVKPYTYDVG
jgi:hypothetical protein